MGGYNFQKTCIFHENPMKFKDFLWKSDEIWWSQINQTRGWNDRFRVGPTRVRSTRPGARAPTVWNDRERVRSRRPGAETIVSGSDQQASGLKRSLQAWICARFHRRTPYCGHICPQTSIFTCFAKNENSMCFSKIMDFRSAKFAGKFVRNLMRAHIFPFELRRFLRRSPFSSYTRSSGN